MNICFASNGGCKCDKQTLKIFKRFDDSNIRYCFLNINGFAKNFLQLPKKQINNLLIQLYKYFV